jgi:hypothetical protein
MRVAHPGELGGRGGIRASAPEDLRDNLVPAAHLLPAVFKPGPAGGFSLLPVDVWLDDPVIPTTERALSRRELIIAVRDQDGGAHSDTDAKLQKSIAYVELVNSFPISKNSFVQTPRGSRSPGSSSLP